MKRRSQNGIPNKKNSKKRKLDSPAEEENVDTRKCNICKQYLKDMVLYSGHLNNSVEEFIALTDDRLSLFTGSEEHIPAEDALPCQKLTYYSVYDENGHLCSFDTGLVEKNVLLYLSGYIKQICEEDASPENGIPAHDVGPINEWYITGFDGGERAIVGIVTAYAHYVLMEPSEDYAPFVKIFYQKIILVKLVIEFLLDNCSEDPTYEDLLFHIESAGRPELTEDFLLQHSQFVCDHIYSYDEAGDETDNVKSLITTPCIRTLVNLCGVTFRKRKKMSQLQSGRGERPKKTGFTKAATTPLVRSVFENFFPDQIQNKDTKGPKKKRCGVCDACQSPDCGKCSHCKDMTKFGGSGRGKQACKQRRCPNMAIENAELSENENESDNEGEAPVQKKISASKRSVNPVEWPQESICELKGRKFYNTAIVANTEVKIGDYVMLYPENPEEPLLIAKIQYMFDKLLQGPTIHVHICCRSIDTILGETADPQELFITHQCEDYPLGCVARKAEVIFRKIPENWFELGGSDTSVNTDYDDKFFYTKQYNIATATFTDYIEDDQQQENIDYCSYCRIKSRKKKFDTAILENETVTWKDETYQIGTTIFLDPSVYKPSPTPCGSTTSSVRSVDENMYPEFYRKTTEVKGSNQNTPAPFCVAQIIEIWDKFQNINLKVRIFYRPEDVKGNVFFSHETSLNLVYWTDDLITVSFDKVAGKCYLLYFDCLSSAEEWCDKGPYRFYFSEAYDPISKETYVVPDHAKKIGYVGKGKGKGKGKSNSSKHVDVAVAPNWIEIDRPLSCMDVFAGCGGLSEGLHESGVAETKWAIEKEVPAAQAYKLNNKNCKVFTDDCNDILETIMSGNDSLKGFPVKGEVEMLVGGPPCQGFSGMNRFNAGQYSAFKNSLVVSYLSYCDYYRPKYFILENVRNFVSSKKSMVLKLTMRCLLAIGYQVAFGILQAGHYGVPQTRRRMILLASAPGYVLPKFPEPQHVFNKRGCHLSFTLDGVRYTNGCSWIESAPYRTICVRDAISDLPEIKNGWNQTEMPYDNEPISHFQRKMRSNNPNQMLVDHICKEMSPIVEMRISYIPEMPGSDWRDLPNIEVKLRDGTMTNTLRYPYFTNRQKKGEPNRGVCQCSLGGSCEPADRQVNTLIPWCLPHTGDRHNQWGGLYGRLEWEGFFGTTITNPEPMGKQGRVLHPEQNRVVSVRECARSQGFPDHFKFYGNTLDKHRQVGNAVPPPLGKAIGLEIKKVFAASTKSIAT